MNRNFAYGAHTSAMTRSPSWWPMAGVKTSARPALASEKATYRTPGCGGNSAGRAVVDRGINLSIIKVLRQIVPEQPAPVGLRGKPDHGRNPE